MNEGTECIWYYLFHAGIRATYMYAYHTVCSRIITHRCSHAWPNELRCKQHDRSTRQCEIRVLTTVWSVSYIQLQTVVWHTLNDETIVTVNLYVRHTLQLTFCYVYVKHRCLICLLIRNATRSSRHVERWFPWRIGSSGCGTLAAKWLKANRLV